MAHDIHAEMLNPNATERQKVWANPISVVILGLIPFGLALNAGGEEVR